MRLFSFMQMDGIKSLISLISSSSHQKLKSFSHSFVEPLAKHLYSECSSNGIASPRPESLALQASSLFVLVPSHFPKRNPMKAFLGLGNHSDHHANPLMRDFVPARLPKPIHLFLVLQ
ncbi:hypothetical protein F2Q69_00030333 [Brassica cretica]|uniref:Uncharacterized protein n=1 Tax=Brassica cretica TaxID=69181 RepID=A0A8S9RU08_BRACR|nr:hypothetical protein F2Q69_00030333 [Brassica cretica]